jgi:isoleucyl-tRNA synthetase
VIALDIEVNDELEVEGRARDLVRLVQQARREADLDVSDRIELTISASEPWIVAIEAHRELIAAETLATSMVTERVVSDDAEPVITVAVAN